MLLDTDGQPHLLEVNSNPSLLITHDVETSPGINESEPSPVDENIKLQAVGDALELVLHKGRQASFSLLCQMQIHIQIQIQIQITYLYPYHPFRRPRFLARGRRQEAPAQLHARHHE